MLYDTIGKGYVAQRRADPRIALIIHRALEGSDSVVNVGAGTGSYEPRDRNVVAIEPSMTMIRQRPDGAAPAIAERDRRRFPSLGDISRTLGPVAVRPVLVPQDCIDGFLGAYWRRPQAYLDPAIRSGMSGFSDLPGLDQGLLRLRRDLDSGEWTHRYGAMLRTQLELHSDAFPAPS